MDNQAQINMQRLFQEKTDLEATYFEQRLKSESFPAAKISDRWKDAAEQSIMRTAPVMLRISMKEYAEVVGSIPAMNKGNGLTLFQFGVLSNSLETRSPKDLAMSPGEYVKFMEEALELIDYYSKRIQIIREDVKKRAENDIKMKATAMSKDRNPLQPVKAEA